MSNDKSLEVLGKIFQEEMGGIARYLHYSFMVMGYNRIPIQKWFREQATECMAHAITIGEKITSLGGHPPLGTARVVETNEHSVQKLLEESLVHERVGLDLYVQLAKGCGDNIALEELARQFIREETEHIEEVQKMLKTSL